jgi:hypothetical protein
MRVSAPARAPAVRTDYSLVHDLANAAGQAACKWCAKCYALAFNGGTR